MPRTYRYRLAGTRLCELFGSELRGTELPGRLERGGPHVLARDLASVCEQGAAATLAIEGSSSDARHRVELEAILLPLVHGGNKIVRIIGAMSPDVPAATGSTASP